jgi:hypothetical protein
MGAELRFGDGGGTGCTTQRIYSLSLTVHLKMVKMANLMHGYFAIIKKRASALTTQLLSPWECLRCHGDRSFRVGVQALC